MARDVSLQGNQRHFGLALTALVAALTVAGCGASASSICDEICDCEGCSDEERDECVDDIEDSERVAEAEGCEDQFDDLADCIDDQLECRDGDLDIDGCEPESDDLEECMDEASVSVGGANACDRAADLCGGTSEPVDCTGSTQCAAQCIVDAGHCDVADVALQECVQVC